MLFLKVLSLLAALISFIPQLKLPSLKGAVSRKKTDNLLFYGDIARFEPEKYLASLYQANGVKDHEYSKFEIDFATQIIVNSQISVRKYKFFQAAILLTLSGIVTPIIAFIVYIIVNRKL